MDYLNLVDKVVIVTGGARGIGECAALLFSEQGAKVVILDKRNELGEGVAAGIREKGGSAIYKSCDVTDTGRIKTVIDEVIAEYGQIDVLINHAGIGANRLLVEEITDQEWEHLMDTNLKSCFNMCREVVPHMKKRKYGKIIFSSSGAGVAGEAYNSHYAVTKGGLITFAKSLCLELAEFKINVNAIAIPSIVTPGSSDTDFDTDMDAEIPEIPLGRLGLTEDVANMMLYLSSDVSSYVSGQAMAPNGGKR